MKARIVEVLPFDGFYNEREVLIGLEGEWDGDKIELNTPVSGYFELSDESKNLPRVVAYSISDNDGFPINFFYLYRVILEEIK